MIGIKEMITLMKANVICEFPDDYIISDNLLDGFTKDDVRMGMKGFSSLLIQLFDVILHEANKPITIEEPSTSGLGLTNVYADIKKPLSLLYAMGVCGKPNDGCLLIAGSKLNELYKKMHGNKPLEYMRLLQNSGLIFSTDLSAKALNLNKIGVIRLEYPDNAIALIGLKTFAEATSKINRHIHLADITHTFARCDYNTLSMPKKYVYEIPLITKFLSEDYSMFFMQLHNLLLSNNCKYEAKLNMNDYQFTYKPKKGTANICSINIAFDRSTVRIKSSLIAEKPDLLTEAPQSIRDAVKNGFTCLKKENVGACNPECVGKNLSFSLDDEEYLKCWIINFLLPIDENDERDFVVQWLKKELSLYK